jgi:kexin
MRKSILCACLAVAWSLCQARDIRDYDTYDYYALHLDPSTSPDAIAAHLGLRHEGPLSVLDHHIFRAAKHDGDIVQDAREELKRRRRAKRDLQAHVMDGVLLTQKQHARKRLVKRLSLPVSHTSPRPQEVPEAVGQRDLIAKTLGIEDPIFDQQWHLFNTGTVGHDLNVTGVWLQGITGHNATVSIIDDGLDMDSLDLQANYFAAGSYDFNEGTDEPKPRLDDDLHGTRCAGEVAAVKNDVCGLGVAYDAKISGIRILSKPISDADEAESVIYAYQENDIYSCSWGPPDDGLTMEGPGILIKRAMVQAVQEGRGGKGTIYVFAAGNGAQHGDNCNFDGYTNSIYSITVGAIDKEDHHPYYSEACSAQLVVTYSSGAGDNIHTTDVGRSKCTALHGGTSAAGPLAAGIYALVLSVRPDLGWRDLQWLTVMTAVPIDADPNDWQETPLGKKFSHQFGYGKLDAYAIVEAAKTWQNVKPQAWYFSPWIHVNHPIPQGLQGLASTFEVTAEALQAANLKRVEHITVTMNVKHDRRGDISVELRSPSGITSHIATSRPQDESSDGYDDWTFMSVAHWGEDGIGNWTVIVKDTINNDKNGSLTDWRLKLYGEAIDGTNQGLLPLPNESDDNDHEVISATPSTTSITLPTPPPTTPPTSSHPTRPAIPKPSTDAGDQASTSPPTTTGSPENSGQGTNDESDQFLPSPFPTFGLSKRTQIWIYAALSLILLFVIALAAYYCVQRRRRLRNARDEYAFEMVGGDDEYDLDGSVGVRGTTRSARRRGRRAGELYDAFAGESDEEGLLSEEEAEEGDVRYRDDKESGSDEGGGGIEERR